MGKSNSLEARMAKHEVLLKNIKQNLPELEKILETVCDEWIYENLIYRYYHQSFKVYAIQKYSAEIYRSLEQISPHEPKKVCDEQFNNIIKKGAGRLQWELEHNQRWEEVCEPMVNAFLHAKYFLEMAVKYGKQFETAPKRQIPFGWAALLELYEIR